MDALSPETIRQGLHTQIFGQTVHYFPSIGSTSTVLKKLANEFAPEGTLCITDDQVAGRGRFERVWHIPANSSLPMSLLFRPTFLSPPYLQQLTMLCALAATDAILAETGLTIVLKWPNDLIYAGRKLAGVLTEASFQGDRLDWVVVGVGLNVNVEADFFAQKYSPENVPLSQVATSLQILTGKHIPRLALLQAYLTAVEKRYADLTVGKTPYADWVAKIETLGKTVTVVSGGERYTALAENVTETGQLQVRLATGELRTVLAGEVSIR